MGDVGLVTWLKRYVVGSHGFVTAIFDGDTIWSAIAVFVVSNYTVLVWVVIDLVLVMTSWYVLIAVPSATTSTLVADKVLQEIKGMCSILFPQ